MPNDDLIGILADQIARLANVVESLAKRVRQLESDMQSHTHDVRVGIAMQWRRP